MIGLLLLFAYISINAQTIATDLAISISSPEFESGVQPGEPATLTIQVTNLGPNPVDFTNPVLQIYPGENLTQNNPSLYFEFMNNQVSEGGCDVVILEGSPLPPDDGVYYLHHYQTQTQIAVGTTFACNIQVAFAELNQWQTTWRLGGPGYSDANSANNTFPFVFRGAAVPVPLKVNWYLIFGVLLLTSMVLNRKLKST